MTSIRSSLLERDLTPATDIKFVIIQQPEYIYNTYPQRSSNYELEARIRDLSKENFMQLIKYLRGEIPKPGEEKINKSFVELPAQITLSEINDNIRKITDLSSTESIPQWSEKISKRSLIEQKYFNLKIDLSTENDLQIPPTAFRSPPDVRRKRGRLSFSFGNVQIDLSEIEEILSGDSKNVSVKYEAEIELIHGADTKQGLYEIDLVLRDLFLVIKDSFELYTVEERMGLEEFIKDVFTLGSETPSKGSKNIIPQIPWGSTEKPEAMARGAGIPKNAKPYVFFSAARNLGIKDLVWGGLIGNKDYRYSITYKVDGLRKIFVVNRTGEWLIYPPYYNLTKRYTDVKQFGKIGGLIMDGEEVSISTLVDKKFAESYKSVYLPFDLVALNDGFGNTISTDQLTAARPFLLHHLDSSFEDTGNLEVMKNLPVDLKKNARPSRMGFIKTLIDGGIFKDCTLKMAMKPFILLRDSPDRFYALIKEMFETRNTLPYNVDIFMFTPSRNCRYNTGTRFIPLWKRKLTVYPDICKFKLWKDLTIDLLVKYNPTQDRYLLYSGGPGNTLINFQDVAKKTLFTFDSSTQIDRKSIESLGDIDNKIVEFGPQSESGIKLPPSPVTQLTTLIGSLSTSSPKLDTGSSSSLNTNQALTIPTFSTGSSSSLNSNQALTIPTISSSSSLNTNQALTIPTFSTGPSSGLNTNQALTIPTISSSSSLDTNPALSSASTEIKIGPEYMRPSKSGSIILEARKMRPDKPRPNNSIDAEGTWNDINDPVLYETLSGQTLTQMRKYHNKIKRTILDEVNSPQKRFRTDYASQQKDVYLIDIGSGNGGDFSKWENYKKILCIEPNPKMIEEFNRRLKNHIDRNPNNKLIDRVRLLTCGGEDTKTILDATKSFFGWNGSPSSGAVNIELCISFMFSLTFFWKDSKTVASLINTINELYLRYHDHGGKDFKVAYITIDGPKLKQFMDEKIASAGTASEVKTGSVHVIKSSSSAGAVEMGPITMKYTPPNKMLVDLKDTIVEGQTEYLVNLEDLFTETGLREIKSISTSEEKFMPGHSRLYTELTRAGISSRNEIDSDTKLDRIKRYGTFVSTLVTAHQIPPTFFDQIAPGALTALAFSGNYNFQEFKLFNGAELSESFRKYIVEGKSSVDAKVVRQQIDDFFKDPIYQGFKWDDHSDDKIGYDELINFDLNSRFMEFALKYGFLGKILDAGPQLVSESMLHDSVDAGEITESQIPRLLQENKDRIVYAALKPLVEQKYYDNVEEYPYIIRMLADYIKANIVIIDSISRERTWYRTNNSQGNIAVVRHPTHYSLVDNKLLNDKEIEALN